LVLNDHVLKGSSSPGVVTGKLSDLAGLVVAPVLVCALVRARSPEARALCFAFVVLPFLAVKVVPAAARAVAVGLSVVGIPSRLWTDPSDLIALVVLPIAWLLARPAEANADADAQAPPRPLSALERAGAVLGSAACLATSSQGKILEGSLFLVNASPRPITLSIRRPSLALDCDALESSPDVNLEPAQFAFDRCLRLPFASPGVLDRRPSPDTAGEPLPPAQHSGCDAVMLSAPGLGSVMILWRDEPKVELDASAYYIDELHPNALYVESFGDRLVIAETTHARVRMVDEPELATECN
jgi:hypothetical protein